MLYQCTLLLPFYAASNHDMQTIAIDVCGVSVANLLNDSGLASLCGVIGSGACSVRCILCVWGHSVQPTPNAFGLLLLLSSIIAGGRYCVVTITMVRLMRNINYVAEANAQLQRLMDVGNQRLQELRRFSEDAYKAVMWLRSNKESFRGVIHEPMMLSVCSI